MDNNGSTLNSQVDTQTFQNGVVALNLIATNIAKVFPQGTAVTNSAGASAGKYLTIIAPDGNTYKIALLLVS